MFVKFVRDQEGAGVTTRKGSPGTVVPCREYLLEAAVLEYGKQVLDGNWWILEKPVTVLGNEPQEGDEIIMLWLPTTGDRIVATHCSMFVMNNEGRTIDSLVCP